MIVRDHMTKIVVDMNLSPRWVDTLERAGFTSSHWSALGAHNAADAEIMRWAREEGYIVLTHTT